MSSKSPKTLDLDSQKQDIIVTVNIVTDAKIQELNKKYLKRDFPTDVLSFSIQEKDDAGKLYLGDIVVSKDRAAEQASDYANTVYEEIAELVAHGMLHLMGIHHDHDDEEEVHGIRLKS